MEMAEIVFMQEVRWFHAAQIYRQSGICHAKRAPGGVLHHWIGAGQGHLATDGTGMALNRL